MNSKSQLRYNLCLLVAGLCLVSGITMLLGSRYDLAGASFVVGLVLLAIAVQGYELLRGFSYTLVIFAAVTMAMFFPQYFVQYNGFKFSSLITPLLQIIMFGMGTAMSIQDFAGVIRMPKGVLVGTINHFTIMPLLGFTLAQLFHFPPEIAAGVILIGCSPCGMASNVISYLAGANLALSITLTTVSTFLAPILTPLLMKLLAGEFVAIDVTKMMWDITKIVIFPVGAGLLFDALLKGKLKWLDNAMPLVSMSGIALIIVVITASGRESLLDIGLALVMASLIHNTVGYFLGYWSAKMFRMPERDCRTIAIEVGMQNGGLASGIAKEMGKVATVGLAPAVFGPLMNITGSLLASWWQRKPVIEQDIMEVRVNAEQD